jgi:demethylmenaquinone methyltransferase/2-methoxy-6-polyprenyl-1,4-benzoquinol methylase
MKKRVQNIFSEVPRTYELVNHIMTLGMDVLSISFATRNINITRDDLKFSFIEIRRVLKTGGRFVNLETSQPKSHVIRSIFHLYVRTFVRPVGYAVSGSKSAYAYLSDTIPKFYPSEELRRILMEAGYRDVEVHKILFGVAAIHIGIK